MTDACFSDGSSIGDFWYECKVYRKCEKREYKKFLTIEKLAEDYAEHQKNAVQLFEVKILIKATGEKIHGFNFDKKFADTFAKQRNKYNVEINKIWVLKDSEEYANALGNRINS
jgi:hypothetical protein